MTPWGLPDDRLAAVLLSWATPEGEAEILEIYGEPTQIRGPWVNRPFPEATP